MLARPFQIEALLQGTDQLLNIRLWVKNEIQVIYQVTNYDYLASSQNVVNAGLAKCNSEERDECSWD